MSEAAYDMLATDTSVAYFIEGPDEWTLDRSNFESACEAGLIGDEYGVEDLVNLIKKHGVARSEMIQNISQELNEILRLSEDGVNGTNKDFYLSMIHRKAMSLKNGMI